MYAAPVTWLDEIVGLPRSLSEALFHGPVWANPEAEEKDRVLDRKAWLVEVLAAAGKVLVIRAPVEAPGGVTLVSDLRLVREDAVHKYEALPGPDLSVGARRLTDIAKFNPAARLVHSDEAQEEAEEPWLGDIVSFEDRAGVVVGVHKKTILAVTGPGQEVGEFPAKGSKLRRVPYSKAHEVARKIILDADWQPNRSEHPDIWDLEAIATEGYREPQEKNDDDA